MLENHLLTIERLVYQRWGGLPPAENAVDQALGHIARREGWTFTAVQEVSAYPSSYQGLEWRDRWGGSVGWSLHILNIAAVSTLRPMWGLPPEFHLTSSGPLFEALGADGSFILPAAEWLLAPLTESDRAALRQGGDGWEVYNLNYWKPHTRAEALFTHWD